MKVHQPRLALLVVLLATGAGCSKSRKPAAAPPDSTAVAGPHHEHVAPHGGTLVPVGAHQFNVEFVRDPVAGRLTAYILDAHADDFVRLPIRGFALATTIDGRRTSLPLAAVANAATGETVGDTSEFSAEADWLRTTEAFTAVIPALDIQRITFTDIEFVFPGDAAAR